MCKVLIFSCISAVMLTTAAYGATISPMQESLIRAAIQDLACLENSKDVSGWFYFMILFYLFFLCIFSEKLTFSPPSLQKIHLDLYTPNDKQVSLNFLFSERFLRHGYLKMMYYWVIPRQLAYQKGRCKRQIWTVWIQCREHVLLKTFLPYICTLQH